MNILRSVVLLLVKKFVMAMRKKSSVSRNVASNVCVMTDFSGTRMEIVFVENV